MLLFTSDTWLKHTRESLFLYWVFCPIGFSVSWNGQFQYLRAVQTAHLALFTSSDLTIQCQRAKGYAPFLFPWDIHSPREETWPRENNGLSEQARALFLGFTSIQSAALWTLSGRRSLEKCLFTWRVSLSTFSAWYPFSWMTRYLQLLMPSVFGPFSSLSLPKEVN